MPITYPVMIIMGYGSITNSLEFVARSFIQDCINKMEIIFDEITEKGISFEPLCDEYYDKMIALQGESDSVD